MKGKSKVKRQLVKSQKFCGFGARHNARCMFYGGGGAAGFVPEKINEQAKAYSTTWVEGA
jgi:hypothetical protein